VKHRHRTRDTLAGLAVVTLLMSALPALGQIDVAPEPSAGASRSTPATDRAGGLLFTLSDDGATFLYRARPGELPSHVAAMFGVPSRDLGAFLAANGISDATRVSPGFTYRIPNPVAAEASATRARSAELERRMRETEARAEGAARQLREMETRAEQAEERAARAARFERLWPLSLGAMVLLGVALASEAEDKRKATLAERQESARRILSLETRVRDLELKLGPRALGGGRSA
jgi:hypothetical protein